MRSDKTAILLILAAGLIAGLWALGGSWHFDDFYTIARNEALRNPANIPRTFWDPSLFSADPGRKMYRPVLQVSYILNFLVTGESVRGFLLVNLLLHLANAILVWAIARELLFNLRSVQPRAPTAYSLQPAASLFAGLIYAVHPVATEGIAYASARSAVLATTFILASLLAYIRWDKGASPAALIGSAVLFILGIGTKAIAIFLPAAVVMYHLWFPSAGGSKLMKPILGLSLMGALAVAYIFLRKALLGVVLAESLVRPLAENIITQACAYMHYFRLFLWPVHQSINPFFPTFSNIGDLRVLASIAILFSLTIVAFVTWKKTVVKPGDDLPTASSLRLISFGLLWILVSLLPESSIVPLNLVVSERRMILPLAGYALMMGALVGMLRPSRRKVVAALLIFCLMPLTIARLREWRSEARLWRSATRIDPDWGLLWNNLGLIYLEDRNTLRAMQMFEFAARHDPQFKEARLNLGQLYAQSGQSEQAENYYREALHLDPGYVKAAVGLAQLWNVDGRKDEARRFIEGFVVQYPASRALYLMGVFKEEDGKAEEALTYYNMAVKGDPFDPLPNLAVGRLLIASGRDVDAAIHLKKFLDLYKNDDRYRQEAVLMMNKITDRQ